MYMAYTGYYSNGVIVTDAKLKEMQKVEIVPMEAPSASEETSFGLFHKYANVSLISSEKETIADAMVKAALSEE